MPSAALCRYNTRSCTNPHSLFDQPVRPRRLRLNAQLRDMVRRVRLRRSDIIVPIFVCSGANQRRPVASMPGVNQMSVDVAVPYLAQRAAEGFKAFLVFGVIDRSLKDAQGSAALDENNVVCQLLRAAVPKKSPWPASPTSASANTPAMDIAASSAPTAPRCSMIRPSSDWCAQALNHAKAGAAVVAPSGMMDGTVGALRRGLDAGGFGDVAILSYAVKYASAFYGPFRDAADSAPEFGDRRSYQMDPARGVEEALQEVQLDIQQGADMVMVKPAMPYLDVLAAVRRAVNVPTCRLPGQRRIRHDRSRRPQRLDRPRARGRGIADGHQACRGGFDHHVLRGSIGAVDRGLILFSRRRLRGAFCQSAETPK